MKTKRIYFFVLIVLLAGILANSRPIAAKGERWIIVCDFKQPMLVYHALPSHPPKWNEYRTTYEDAGGYLNALGYENTLVLPGYTSLFIDPFDGKRYEGVITRSRGHGWIEYDSQALGANCYYLYTTEYWGAPTAR